MTPESKNARIFQIMCLVQSYYLSSGDSDSAFADYASQKLGFVVKRGSITQARKDLGIANNVVAPQSLAARVKELEEAMTQAILSLDEINDDAGAAATLRAALHSSTKSPT